jgi:starch phosphorylase
MDPALQGVISAIEKGTFEDPKIFQPLISTLTVGKDFYLISADFASYITANQQVDAAYKNQEEWSKKSILCTAHMGKFSS